MTEDFKGVPGGDPSRMPKSVTVKFECKHCHKVAQVETRKPRGYTAPDYCSGTCKHDALTEVVRELLAERGYEIDINWRAARAFAILYGKKRDLFGQLSANPELIRQGKYAIRMFPCQHCGTAFSRVVETRLYNPARYCSEACRGSSRGKLPFGLICHSPYKKMSGETREDMEATLATVNKELAEEGDTEGLIAYSCTCGKWHAGHDSRREWDEQSLALMDDLDRDLDSLVIANMSQKGRARWNKQRKDALFGRLVPVAA